MLYTVNGKYFYREARNIFYPVNYNIGTNLLKEKRKETFSIFIVIYTYSNNYCAIFYLITIMDIRPYIWL